MARPLTVKFMITPGIGFNPGHIKYIVTRGLLLSVVWTEVVSSDILETWDTVNIGASSETWTEVGANDDTETWIDVDINDDPETWSEINTSDDTETWTEVDVPG